MTKRLLRENYVNDVFKYLEKPSAEVVSWMDKEVLDNYMVYENKNGWAYCTHCDTDMDAKEVDGIRQGKKVVCPRCGATVTAKAIGRMKASTWDYGYASFAQRLNDDVVVRYYTLSRHLGSGNYKSAKCEMNEVRRDLLDGSGRRKVFDKYRYEWVFCSNKGLNSDVATHFRFWRKYNSGTYLGNLDNVLSGTRYKYSLCVRYMRRLESGEAMDRCYGYKLDLDQFDIALYLEKYDRCPAMEWMQKVGLERLADEYYLGEGGFDKGGKTLQDVLGITRMQLRELLECKGQEWESMDAVGYLKKQRARTLKDYRNICIALRRDSGIQISSSIEDFCSLYTFPTELLLPYIRGQRTVCSPVFDVAKGYFDYLRTAEQNGWDMKSKFVVFPKNLMEAHDTAVRVRNDKLQAEQWEREKARLKRMEDGCRKYIARLGKLKRKYKFEDGGIEIVVPASGEDIAREGIALHHCVGTYIADVYAEKTLILFVRMKSDEAKPFYTMEVRDGMMEQCRGFGNRDMTDEVRTFVEKFCEAKKIKNTMAA